MTFSILDFYPHNYLCPMLYLAYSILPLDEQNRSYSRERRGLDLNRWLCVLPNSRATMATSKGGCCLATGNINEEISKLYLEKKKKKTCFGGTSGVGINVHHNSFMKPAEYIITNLKSIMLYKGKISNKWLIPHFM